MNNLKSQTKVIEFATSGTCCKLIQLEINNDTITKIHFVGGCPGNLIGIEKLITGMKVDEVIQKLSGIRCGDKQTSCPDQLSKCLSQVMLEKV